MQSRRHERVRELLIRTLGEVVRREFSVDEIGVITVTDVGVANDMQSAMVFISVLGTEEQQLKCLNLLKNNRKHLQTLLGQAVTLKYTPRLMFRLDSSIERGDRVLNIMQELETSDPSESSSPPE
jgi:ribosome-binding factor A